MRHFRPSLRQFDLTEQQWRVLRALASIPESEVTQLANATCLLAPSLSRILKDLEDRGLILRRTSDMDMRLGLVSISLAGSELIEKTDVFSEQIYGEIARRFGAARIVELMDLLRQLETVLGQGEPIDVNAHEAKERRPIARKRGRPPKPNRN